jgi:glycosyltransferase involved in cell wall biosynthesis
MRILILSSFVPDPEADHAGGVVLWRMIQGLAAHNEISLITFAHDDVQRCRAALALNCCESVRTIPHPCTSATISPDLQIGSRVRSLLLSSLPYDVWRFRARQMADAISEAVARTPYDIIQFEFIQMGQYAQALSNDPRTIFRRHDLAFSIYRRQIRTAGSVGLKIYRTMQWRRMQRYELAVCQQFRRVIVPSRKTKADLLARLPSLDVSVVPFGVSLPHVTPDRQPSAEKRILFVGALGRRANVEAVEHFALKIWPYIKKEEPESEFWIVGSHPPPPISQLAQKDSHIKVTGSVDKLEPFYAQASVFVAPILVGGGVITKTLNAMALSKAVVTTSIGNEGIEATPEQDLLIADQPHEFARRVVELLRDPARRRQIGQNGRRFVEGNFNWESIIDRLERIYAEMIENRIDWAYTK